MFVSEQPPERLTAEDLVPPESPVLEKCLAPEVSGIISAFMA